MNEIYGVEGSGSDGGNGVSDEFSDGSGAGSGAGSGDGLDWDGRVGAGV